MKAREITIGVDIGGTNTVLGVVDRQGAILHRVCFATDEQRSAQEFVERLASVIRGACSDLPYAVAMCGVGVAAPAARHREGVIRNPANLPWGTFNIVQMLRAQFDVPIALMNDSNATALGEMHFGATAGMKNFIAVTLGTGLGAGIVVDGRLLSGEREQAGELGHIIIEPGGRACGCRRRGCAETYVSASGLCRTALELLSMEPAPSAMRSVEFNRLTAERIHEFAVAGDPLARAAFERTGAYLGRLLSDAAAIFDPEAIIVSGGLANAGEMILAPARTTFENSVLESLKGQVAIRQSLRSCSDAAILGVAGLVGEQPGAVREHFPRTRSAAV